MKLYCINILFCWSCIEDMKGMNVRNWTEVLTGGARIYRIMRESFCKKLDEMNPFKNLSDTNILTAINVSRNVNPELLIPEEAFRSLIRQLIATFDSPWKQLVTLIYDEMVNALHKVKDPELDKYERLKDFIISRMIEFFSECKKNALIHTENIIEWEDAYINVEHDDIVHLKDIWTMKNVPDSDRLRIYYILDMLNIKKSLFKETLNLNDEIIREEEEKAFERSNNENRNIVDVDRTNVTENNNWINSKSKMERQLRRNFRPLSGWVTLGEYTPRAQEHWRFTRKTMNAYFQLLSHFHNKYKSKGYILQQNKLKGVFA